MNIQELQAKAQTQKSENIKGQYLGAIDYKGEKIAQYHNPSLFIDDMIGENQTMQFTSIMVIGTPGSGKSTLKNFIMHQIHTRDPSYQVFNFGRKELQDFDRVMDKLPNRNLALGFDDVSLALRKMKDPEKKDRILQTLTEARHPKFEESDRKVFIISNVHYQNSLEKMWRSQGGWKFYTNMTDEEAQVFNALTKGRYKKKVELFGRTTLKQFRKKEFTVSLTNKQTRTYVAGGVIQDNPKSLLCGQKGVFRFVLCYDTASIRFFLVPEEFCNLCDPKKDRIPKIKITPREAILLMQKYYGKHGKQGLKYALDEVGEEDQLPNKTINAKRLAYELISTFDINASELADTIRKDARYPKRTLNISRKKRADFFNDIMEIRNNEGKITFASMTQTQKIPKGILEDEDNEETENLDL